MTVVHEMGFLSKDKLVCVATINGNSSLPCRATLVCEIESNSTNWGSPEAETMAISPFNCYFVNRFDI